MFRNIKVNIIALATDFMLIRIGSPTDRFIDQSKAGQTILFWLRTSGCVDRNRLDFDHKIEPPTFSLIFKNKNNSIKFSFDLQPQKISKN